MAGICTEINPLSCIKNDLVKTVHVRICITVHFVWEVFLKLTEYGG